MAGNGRASGAAAAIPGRSPRERPILFSGPMVRAILAGDKTQTRRVMKPQPSEPCSHVEPFRGDGGGWIAGDNTGRIFRCPYGEPGDRLWVRETWLAGYGEELVHHGDKAALFYRADGKLLSVDAAGEKFDEGGIEPDCEHLTWRPSIFMPRWASRLTLAVTEVRAQRVQEISEEDARAECRSLVKDDPAGYFQETWDSINGKRLGCAWADNPWVWCVSFRQAAAPESKIGSGSA